MRDQSIKKVLMIGSGPIVIGQAAEFDYAGTQACRSLKEEGVEVVLLNSNPATIMTDKDIADHVYIEPLTVEVVEKLIEKEKPDSVLPTLGGQAGLNLAMALDESGFLKSHNVRLIGTTALTIKKAEDRLMFKETMEKIGEPVAASEVVHDVEAGLRVAESIGYPVVLRPAYTLGGSGGGIAANPEECREILENGLRLSRVHEVLVERSIAGWKEIEYEVMRDGAGNVITVCNMENLDPVGVHTGDSIVVAPSQTLSDKEYQMLRTSALNIITELGITGGCNVQYALNPDSFEYCVIEVNPRVSRSSALASKATGYPIAKVAAKIALGYTLDEIKNAVTGKTYASFEPMLDYCVVKMPRLPFDKFITAEHLLGTQMKATGEVMAIAQSFEGGLMKAIRSLEQHVDCLLSYDFTELDDHDLRKMLHRVDDRRIWVVAEALRRGFGYAEIHEITKIDVWFIDKLKILVDMEKRLHDEPLSENLLREAKRIEFPDNVIGRLTGRSTEEIRALREEYGILASFKMVDTCAAEFEAETPYYYSVFDGSGDGFCRLDPSAPEKGRVKLSGNEATGAFRDPAKKKKVLVLGSGPIRIGQGIEFDFCSVHSTWAFRREGYETIIINNNPETVSTDFDIADKLYFEPLTPEDVRNIVDIEKPDGAVVQFGGQTAIKLTESLMKMGVPIWGTKAEDVDAAEDRELFDKILEQTGIPRAAGGTVFTAAEAKEVANRLGYPVLVRPSYVLGGQGMQIAYFDIADKLYFEPLTDEDVRNVVDIEKPDGAVVQFGGQTAIKLTEALMKMGVPILGTQADDVDAAEDRERFDAILQQTGISRPAGHTVFTAEEAKAAAHELGYPVLVRPSYVLGGQGMRIAISDQDIDEFIGVINQIAQEHPILVDKYIRGKELEVDAICDGQDILIPGIMEHIERTGIHSGDSISVYPSKSITAKAKASIIDYTERLAKALHVIGMVNIQFIADGDDVYIIEVNPRSSRTVPYISKVTGIPIVPLATQIICGHTIRELGYTPGLQKEAEYYAIKMPVFSFEKIKGADISLGPEMKSTGECLGIAKSFNEALYKAFQGAGIHLPQYRNMVVTVKDEDKKDIVPIAKRFAAVGYRIFATRGTYLALKEGGVPCYQVRKVEQESPNILDLVLGHELDIIIDTPKEGAEASKDGFVIRRNAIETGVNVLTAIDTAEALATALENNAQELSLIDIAKI